ncbi:molybdate ABC transporter substrate-binding protein [Pelagibacterium xiamenense]|uniref:molybdate ABC transporter substrate-binding protein n=1 Tax=Pelagibacterium xiamenense TaxID=2901140 RepID=UPI001E5D95D3|nr:molybdate ABC transporter substrate-binding protein [Pelagibacterium xiamenense]MCD7060553.1 molybdate ABC transporter substrate-binding protein [Pelagibacterium xiamenense]
MRLIAIITLVLGTGISPAPAQNAQVAVAANFTAAAEDLAEAFAVETGLEIGLSFGATGQLYAQITQGAPFDAFLAADTERPGLLVEAGLAVGASRFTYAVGRLALFSADPALAAGPESLEGDFERLAIAEPGAAPYGAAAVEVIAALGLTDALADRLVIGQNIAQAYQFVATSNAELGFVALSQIAAGEGGSHWVVPEEMHAPIAQDAVLLDARNEAASAFLGFLASARAREIIEAHGYGVRP